MKALLDKAELKARNKAYKVTLEYCDETCDDVDMVFTSKYSELINTGMFNEDQLHYIDNLFLKLNNEVKEVGTRKLRKAFTDYVLENTKE